MNRPQPQAMPPSISSRGPDALSRELVRLDALLALATPEEAYHAQQHELDQPGGSIFAVTAVELLAVVWEGLPALETLRGNQRERERLRLITLTGLVYGLRLLGSLIEHDGPDTVLDMESGDSTAEAVIYLVQRLRATVGWLRETQFELRVAMIALDALFQDLDAASLTVPVMMEEVSFMWVALEVLGDPMGVPVPAVSRHLLDGALLEPQEQLGSHQKGEWVLPWAESLGLLEASGGAQVAAGLLGRLSEVKNEEARAYLSLALTILLLIEARAYVPGVPVITGLEISVVLLLGARSALARQRLAVGSTPLREALALHQQMAREVRAPRSGLLRTGFVPQASGVELAVGLSCTWLATVRLSLSGVRPVSSLEVNAAFWRELEAVHTLPLPLPEAPLRWLRLLTASSVLDGDLAPGMEVPGVLQYACELTGVDPLWGWTLRGREALREVFWMAAMAVQVKPERVTPQECLSVLGHLLSCLSAQRLELGGASLGGLRAWAEQYWGAQMPMGPMLPQAWSALTRRWGDLLQGGVGLELGSEGSVMRTIRAMAGLSELEEQVAPTAQEEPEALAGPELLEMNEAQEETMSSPVASVLEVGRARSASVLQVRELLQGRRVVVLGGVPFPAHHQALVEAFGLAELDWIPSERYDNGWQAEAHVRQPGTALVIFALRWAGHAHNTIREVARKYEVPFVMHPAGLNPNQVAWQVLAQVCR